MVVGLAMQSGGKRARKSSRDTRSKYRRKKVQTPIVVRLGSSKAALIVMIRKIQGQLLIITLL